MNKFCTNCGHELKPEEKFCPSCGFNTESVKQAKESVSNTQNVNSYQNTNQYQNANAYQNPNNAAFGNDDITMKNMLAQLSQKNQTNAIIWIVIGALQIIGAIYMFAFYDASIYTLAVMAIGILNIVAGYKDYKYSKELLQRPIAIISGNQSLSRYGQKAFRKTGRDAKYYPRIWRFRASKLSWLKSCSIRQASAEAVSGETPSSTSHWLISV